MEHVTSKLRMKRGGGGGRERESEEKLYDRDSARAPLVSRIKKKFQGGLGNGFLFFFSQKFN